MFDNVVIIDNGSGYTKVGYSEDEDIKFQLPTVIGKPKYQNEILDIPYDQKIIQKKKKKNFEYTSGIIGNTALNSPSIYNLNFPIKNGIIQDHEDLLDLYFYIYFNELKLEPSKYPLLLTQNLMSTNNCRQKLMEICFEQLKVPILGISYQNNFALKGLGRLTGLILDSGFGGSQIVPIIEDFYLGQGVIYKSFLSGQTLNELIQDYLNRCKIYELDIYRDFKLIEKIKQQFCKIKNRDQNFEQRYRKTTHIKTLYNENPKSGKICELPDGSIADLGLIPDITTDLFFDNQLLGFEGDDFVQMILKSIQSCDIDYRKELLQSIVFSGGNQKIEGMQEYLKQQLQKEVTVSKLIISMVRCTCRNIIRSTFSFQILG